MAIVHRGRRTLYRTALTRLAAGALCAGAALIYGWAALRLGAGQLHPALHLLPVAAMWGAWRYYRMCRRFLAGARGETALLKTLRALPNRYHVFTNFVMEGKGGKDEADFIVVGDTGLFVVEVKHHAGEIVGTEQSFEWRQRKKVKGGKYRERRFCNPIAQAKRHADHARRLLGRYGANASAVCVLVFTNPNAQLRVKPGGAIVLRGAPAVKELILNGAAKKALSRSEVEEIVRTLKKIGQTRRFLIA